MILIPSAYISLLGGLRNRRNHEFLVSAKNLKFNMKTEKLLGESFFSYPLHMRVNRI